MVTNEERHEVAQKLRQIDHDVRKYGEFSVASHLNAIERAMGLGYIPVTDDSIYSRLADLIEPEPERTMSPIYRTSDYFECPLCGHDTLKTMYWTTSDDDRQVVHTEKARYCGHCGAKVVYEDE